MSCTKLDKKVIPSDIKKKVDLILSIENLEERLEMNSMSTMACCNSSYCFNGNTISLIY